MCKRFYDREVCIGRCKNPDSFQMDAIWFGEGGKISDSRGIE